MTDRVRLIFAVTTFSVLEPVTVRAANRMAADCGDDEECIVSTVFETHRALIRYAWEQDGVDVYRSWKVSVREGVGDCDCMVIANNAILSVLGFPVGVACVRQAGVQDHIWSLVWIPRGSTSRRTIALDLAAPNAPVGWEEPASAYTGRKNYRYDAHEWIAWCRRYYNGMRPESAVEDILRTAPTIRPM